MTIKNFLGQDYVAILICLFAVFGFMASFTLSVDKIAILQDPNQSLPCNISGLLNCGAVMRSPYASVNNIPWSFFGVAGYPAALLLGLFLIERKKVSPWLAILTTLPAIGAFGLSTYFMWLSAYVIGVFCPWCILSAISSMNILFGLLSHHLANKNFGLPDDQAEFLARKIRGSWHVPVIFLWFLGIILLVWWPFRG
jgi:uncharacterized membrane protein